MNISIRNIDDAAVARIDQLAKKKGVSRESYIRTYLESLSVIDEMRALDMKYQHLVKEIAEVIQNNSQHLNDVYTVLKKINEKNI